MVLAYKDGFSKAQELTQAINVIPNQWGLIQQLGLFTSEYKIFKSSKLISSVYLSLISLINVEIYLILSFKFSLL